jgi:hypothetical protein
MHYGHDDNLIGTGSIVDPIGEAMNADELDIAFDIDE